MESSGLKATMRLALTSPLRVLSACHDTEPLLGYPPEDWLSSRISLRQRIHPDDDEIARVLFSADLSNPAGSVTLRIRHADGRIRVLRADYTKERERDEVILNLTLADDRQPGDSALETAVAGFKAMLDYTGDYMYLKNRNHACVGASQTMSQLIGDTESKIDFNGKNAYELYPEPAADVLYSMDNQVLTEGRATHEVQRVVLADGSHRWIDNRKYPLKNPAGATIGLFGICPDITAPIDAEHKLRESRTVFQLFIEHAPAALAMFDREMRYVAASRRWLQDFGLSDLPIIGRSHYESMPEIPDRWKALHQRALAGEALHRDEDRFVRADCSVQWLRWAIHPWRTSEGAIGGIVIFSEDITQQRQDKEQLQLAASVFANAREAIMICDPKGSILDVNEMFTRITGYSRAEVLRRNPRILKSGRQSNDFYSDMWRALLENGQWSGEIWNKAKDGRIYPEMLAINAVYDRMGHVQHYVALFSDITHIKEHERQMERVAHYDALTNLPNRTLLVDRLQQAMALTHRRGQMLAVACLDLDGFRAINDRYGHETGDDLLTGIAQRLKLELREADSIARIGGDEFVAVLLDLTDAASAAPLLDKLLASVLHTEPGNEPGHHVSASMGVAFYPQSEATDAGQLLRQAGQAMYQAKLAGKNCRRTFDPHQDMTIRTGREGVEQIEHALHAEEFVLFYQPRVNMCTGDLVGTEALIRWQHPTRGLLSPAAFLPEIENHPLIDRLGEWVIDRALTQLEIWHAAGLEFPISVNIAAHHLQRPDFADRLRALLAAHPRVRSSHLELEVLETSALDDVAQISHLLAVCREIGVSIALDDFGTAYSSLTYLRRLPVNTLKIDQSFVRDMLDTPEDLSILEGVLGLATAFDRLAVAEGVETVEHGRLLLQLGCCYGQGFGIAYPMPAEDLPAWSASWKPDPTWASAASVAPGKRAMLHAAVALRAWVAAMDSYLSGERRMPPPLDPHRCRFGKWLDGELRSVTGAGPAFQKIDHLHRRMHERAGEFSTPDTREPSQITAAQMQVLHRLRDAILEELELLLNDVALSA